MISAVATQPSYGETVHLDLAGSISLALAAIVVVAGLALIAYAVAPRRERVRVTARKRSRGAVAPLDRRTGVHDHGDT